MSFELDVLQQILAEQKKTNELLTQLTQPKPQEVKVMREKEVRGGKTNDNKQNGTRVYTKRRGA